MWSRASERVFHSWTDSIICLCSGALVANKVDLGERRVVGVAEGRSFAQSKDLQYFECSAVSHASYILMSLCTNFFGVYIMPYMGQAKKGQISLSRIFLKSLHLQVLNKKVQN